MPTILVTGSSRGIGRAIAETLRVRGARVIGHATYAWDTDTVAADLAEPSAPQLLWEQALELAGGRIDALVNNAGALRRATIETGRDEDFEYLW